jgi:hypothetical protein
MERIKHFLLDEAATAEASSTVIMIAAVGLLLAAGLVIYYSAANLFFSNVGTEINQMGTGWGGTIGS